MSLPPIGGWRVTGQRQTQQLIPGSPQFTTGVEVSFITGYGVTGSVFVPNNQYTTDTVQSIIGDRVKQLDAISTLTHQS